MSKVRTVTDDDFTSVVLDNPGWVLVDFWAPWCAPCLQIAPVLEQIAEEQADRLTIAKVNVDENPVTSSAYRVTGLPTLNLYRNGDLVKTIRGARPKSVLLRDLEEVIIDPSTDRAGV